ncbi:uncharacterized protein BT62DRAFT_302812 [Guyanagaster necrorhizus]|uniref:MYND-type domain-containing protein n=1 Tax=Guyanagaster necrorhizus TaxID=856835 RepID=A0A9P8ARH0_9AGAR|nr:uncharacterized protein BT62DRAFT_302812 [Guyanagaster necrorhizus MCA 3950]KAG7443857.1 hypothetical protein BT62DRAFT_302812 [Guyanagaster necrorhizus MCA 3950]
MQRKKQAMNGSVSVLEKIPGSQIFPGYIEVFERHLSPNKVPLNIRNSLTKPSTIMAMACFRAICRGLEFRLEPARKYQYNLGDILKLWSGIRAWCLHFISICTSKSLLVSNSMADFDVTAMMTATAICLRCLPEIQTSYHTIICTDKSLHPPVVELWRESCRSSCHVAVRNLSDLLVTVFVSQDMQSVVMSQLEVNPEETARLCFNAVLEDDAGGAGYSDRKKPDSVCLILMLRVCQSPTLANAMIHEQSVRFTCTVMGRLAAKIMKTCDLPPTHNIWSYFMVTVSFVNTCLSHSNFPIVLALVDTHVLEILLRIWPFIPIKYLYRVEPVILAFIDTMRHYTVYRSITRCVVRSLASLDKKGVIVDPEQYTVDIAQYCKHLVLLAQYRSSLKEECDKLPDVCFTCRRTYIGSMPCCSQCQSTQYCSRSCQRTHWKQGHKEQCKKSCVGIRDRKFLAYLGQITVMKHESHLSPLISMYMNDFSIRDRASLVIEVVLSGKTGAPRPDISIKSVADNEKEVGEKKPWFSHDCERGGGICGVVRVLAPGGIDQSHECPVRWSTIGRG